MKNTIERFGRCYEIISDRTEQRGNSDGEGWFGVMVCWYSDSMF